MNDGYDGFGKVADSDVSFGDKLIIYAMDEFKQNYIKRFFYTVICDLSYANTGEATLLGEPKSI